MNSTLEKISNYYEVLDVHQEASIDEIKKSYKKLVLKFHPDVCKENHGTEKFKKITKAYSILKDTNLRLEYDRQLRMNQAFLPIIGFRYCHRELKKVTDHLFAKFKIFFKNISRSNDILNNRDETDDNFFGFDVPVREEILKMPLEELEERLQFSQNCFVRINAAVAIGLKREKKSYYCLERMLNDSNDNVKKAVVWAIGNLKMKKSLHILKLLFYSNKSVLRVEILKSIYKIVNAKDSLFNELLIRAINDEIEEIRIGALNLLLRIDKKVHYNEIRSIFNNLSLKCRILLDKIIIENKIQNYPGGYV